MCPTRLWLAKLKRKRGPIIPLLAECLSSCCHTAVESREQSPRSGWRRCVHFFESHPTSFFFSVYKKMAYSTPIRQWTIDDVTSTSPRSQIAKIRCGAGNICLQANERRSSPLEPGTFDKDPSALHLNLVLECVCEFTIQIRLLHSTHGF